MPSAPILIDGGQNFDDVPYGVNPFGKNANQRPLARPSSPIMAPIVAAPRIAAQPRALVPQQSMLQLPRSFQTASQPFRPQPIRAAQPQPQQLRTLPIIDRSQLNEKNAQILRQDQEVNPDGSYNFSFETDNGIARSETGTPKVLGGNPPVVAEQVTGSYSYTENGVQYKVTYIADENGFRAFVSVNILHPFEMPEN